MTHRAIIAIAFLKLTTPYTALAEGGDAARGERMFVHACHVTHWSSIAI
jgi:hypothetical protein